MHNLIANHNVDAHIHSAGQYIGKYLPGVGLWAYVHGRTYAIAEAGACVPVDDIVRHHGPETAAALMRAETVTFDLSTG